MNVTVALYKRMGGSKDPNNYRGIALVSAVCKLFMYIILGRIQPTIEKCIAKEQAGFRPHRGTEEQLFILDNIIDRYKRAGKPLYVCFVGPFQSC
jgi:hypothetical protein